jgi:homoserine dehydrogenase
MINIALFGYGQVGKEVVRLLTDSQEFNIKYIVGLGSEDEPAHIIDPEIVYADRNVSIVIDATSGDIEESEAAILALAKSGKKIISSNQQLWKERGRMIRRQLESKNLPVILLNSLAAGPNVDTAQENINLRNLHQFEPYDLFAYRGTTEVHTAKAIIQDLLRISS